MAKTITFGVERHPKGGFVPVVHNDNRRVASAYAHRAWDEDTARQLAKREAHEEAGRYSGDWGVSVEETPGGRPKSHPIGQPSEPQRTLPGVELIPTKPIPRESAEEFIRKNAPPPGRKFDAAERRREAESVAPTRRPRSDPMSKAARELKRVEARGDMAEIEKAREKYHSTWAAQRAKREAEGHKRAAEGWKEDARAVADPEFAKRAAGMVEHHEMAAAQATKEHYWKERDQRQREFFAKNPAATHADFARAEKPFSDAAKKQMGPAGKALEHAVARSERREGTAKEALETGVRGGRYYVSPTGTKVYVKSNPGPEVVGHMSNQRFYQGLPMSVHLAEPKVR